ncbi:methyltransferase domain-containing protein [Cryptosporangium aurantiacum]|uniref:Methyltransferase domain-containing protein n=1 Tax=Cryptosporangium aurantiacum TaxID=134849 RepID=A0A1M7R835_9ACTN|nr:methyltransferase domain-containing protein [Cryptosporangium aurantiacum]SHN42208.1 Methyltransferase domain-containing protein [Cryptosporangium aurantiacum]
MNTTTAERYSLGHTPQEYERLRAQARGWEAATDRLFDRIGVAEGARCLDAGCGPGETMLLLARRVGPTGRVVGLDIDPALGDLTRTMLSEAGHGQCTVQTHDLSADEPVPGGPYDLVYARLLLFHLPERVAVLRRLWEAVAPGGHLVVQEYDVGPVCVRPSLDSVEEITRVIIESFTAAGADPRIGAGLPDLLARAGIDAPDGTDVVGRLETLERSRIMVEQTYRSLLPVALAHGVTTEEAATDTLAALDRDVAAHPERPLLWPLLLGVWKSR